MRTARRLLPLVVVISACQTVQATKGSVVAAHKRSEANHASAEAASRAVAYADGCPRTEDRPPLGTSDTTWHEVQAETRAVPIGERPAGRLPWDAEIASARVELQFAVDVAGCVDMRTVTVLESSNRDATEAAKKVLPLFRYAPATRKGGAVRQWVQERVRVSR